MSFEGQLFQELINLSYIYTANLKKLTQIEKLKNEKYSKLFFVNGYGYERSGATKELRIAAIKSINKFYSDKSNSISFYYNEYSKGGNVNPLRNPCLDENLQDLNFTNIITSILNKDIENAFNLLMSLKGIGHKIASFFIRDILILHNIESNSLQDSQLYLSNPIDVWIRIIFKQLSKNKIFNHFSFKKKYLNKEDFNITKYMIHSAREQGIDLFKLNIGAWHFGALVCGTKNRVEYLLAEKSIPLIKGEIDYSKNYYDLLL